MNILHALIIAVALLTGMLSFPVHSQSEPAKLLDYEVVGRSDTEGPRPVLLALPPGNQSRELVEFVEQLYWQKEAERLGWTVISPVAPSGESLSGSNIDRVLQLVEHIERTYEVEDGRVHVAGASNGGRTALQLALVQPERFASLSLLPGMQEGIEKTQIESLIDLPIAMYVGGNDRGWLVPMQAMADELTKLGHAPAVLRVFEGEGHTPKSLTGEILFKALESFRQSQ